jgi:hypothetical protein
MNCKAFVPAGCIHHELLISVPLRRPRNRQASSVAAFGPPAWQDATLASVINLSPAPARYRGEPGEALDRSTTVPARSAQSLGLGTGAGRHGASQSPAPSPLQFLQPRAAPLKIQQSKAAEVCDEACSLEGLAMELS